MIRVLGALNVTAPGVDTVGGPTQRRILACLVMHAGDVVTVDQLVDITWPESPPHKAECNLQVYICRLRQALDSIGGCIVTTAPGYALRLPDATIDVCAFEDAAAAAGTALGGGDPLAASEAASHALALCRGRPYAEFADERWATAEVVRLEQLRDAVLEIRCEALSAVGRWPEALSELDRLVEERPLWERPRELQMYGLTMSGRRVEALRLYQRFRSFVLDEIGVGPSKALVELDRAIAAEQPLGQLIASPTGRAVA